MRTDLSIQPPYSSLPYGALITQLSKAVNASLGPGLQVGTLLALSADGLPANRICEIGELSGLNGTGNTQDNIALNLNTIKETQESKSNDFLKGRS